MKWQKEINDRKCQADKIERFQSAFLLSDLVMIVTNCQMTKRENNKISKNLL